MVRGSSLPPHLIEAAELAEAVASEAGLTFFDVVFEMLEASSVNALAAYGGFPTRYPSWRFGMEYERLARGHQWGLSKIYELVINHDPTIAYLVRSNSFLEQKLVMAHVYGHADFFKNSAWFAPTDRRMVERFEEHARRIKGHVARLGQERVETFLDAALSLDTLMDPYGPARAHREHEARTDLGSQVSCHDHSEQDAGRDVRESGGAGAWREASLARLEALQGSERGGDKCAAKPTSGAEGPSRDRGVDSESSAFDVLRYLAREAPLEEWQRDIMEIVAYEAEYFMPQRMTKIINEGWASFWHSRLLTGGLLSASEIIEFADTHSGATAAAPGQLNPYKLGIDLFRYAEEKGEDLFQLRSVHNDVTFLDAIVDDEFVRRSQLFAIERGQGPAGGPVQGGGAAAGRVGSRDPKEVKLKLLEGLAWGGQPRIRLEAGGPGEPLVLRHLHDGRDLKLDEAGVLLRTIGQMWKQPVELVTQENDEGRRLICAKDELSLREAQAS